VANINEYFLDVFLKLFLAMFTFNLGMLLTVLSISNILFYYASASLWIVSILFILKEMQHLRWIKDNLEFRENDEPQIRIDVNDEDYVKVLKLYANGSLTNIMKHFHLSHPQQAKRLLRKSIVKLLERQTVKKERM